MQAYQGEQELHVVADSTKRVRNAMKPVEAQRIPPLPRKFTPCHPDHFNHQGA